MVAQGRALLALGPAAVLMKGGHLEGDAGRSAGDGGKRAPVRSAAHRVAVTLHGTGCVLSSAIVAHMALGRDLVDAVDRAKMFRATSDRERARSGAGAGAGTADAGPLSGRGRWADFYAALPVIDDFARAVAPEAYQPLPDDWRVGFADVRGSTAAVAAGRYKAVNMIGAGVVAAVSNALARKAFPFVFGGDGASFAVAPEDADAAEAALRAMATFAREEFDFELRVALATVADIRAGGRDVRVARYGPSPHCAYAMFAGGGLAWLDGAAKSGRFALEPAAPGARPDLSDLSCRWGVTPARHGLILSLIVAPRGDDPRFAPFLAEFVRDAVAVEDGGRPVTLGNRWSAARRARRSRWKRAVFRAGGASGAAARAKAALIYGLGFLFKTFDLKLGDFDMKQYKRDLVANADFRKFDDGLRMTLDCSAAFADALEAKLAAVRFRRMGRCCARRARRSPATRRSPPAAATCISSTAPAAATRWRPRR